jgi:hypothetical protein
LPGRGRWPTLALPCHIEEQTMQRHVIPFLVLAVIAGCASGPPFVDVMQPKALAMAERRGQFETNCPAATGEVLNRQQLDPLMFGGPVRAKYTVGVAGCGRRTVVDVLCSENNNQCVEGR